MFCLKATSKGVDIGAHTVIYSVSLFAMFFFGGGVGGGSRGDICKSGRRHVRHPIQCRLQCFACDSSLKT